jgi:hypothetical protein
MLEHSHAAEAEPMRTMQMEPMDAKPAPDDHSTNIGEIRRKRFSDFLKSRPMRSSGRMRTMTEHPSAGDRRHEVREEKEIPAERQAAEHGPEHRHSDAPGSASENSKE